MTDDILFFSLSFLSIAVFVASVLLVAP